MPTSDAPLDLLAQSGKAWPFEQAKLLLQRVEKSKKTGPVVFETGYGPSGLPHIGTFGEVVRLSRSDRRQDPDQADLRLR